MVSKIKVVLLFVAAWLIILVMSINDFGFQLASTLVR